MTQTAENTAALQRAQQAYHDGRMKVVETECRRVLESSPSNAEAWVLMATVARHHGHLNDAAEMMRRAVQLRPENPHMKEVLASIYLSSRDWRNAQPLYKRLNDERPAPHFVNALAKCAWGTGDYKLAVERFREAADAAPSEADLQIGLIQALVSHWRDDEALEVAQRLLRARSDKANVWMLLGRLMFSDGDLRPALECMARGAACDDATAVTHANHAALLKLAGRPEAAADSRRLVPENPRLDAEWEGFEYGLTHRPPGRFMGFADQVLRAGLEAAPTRGQTLEFGVYFGRSLQLLADRTRGPVHGFDSFQGLPEAWSRSEGKGAYSTGGVRPSVPGDVTLHEGWFEDTLPAFVAANPRPARFLHVDCDLYSSTRTVLRETRPLMRAGTIIVFDDYFGYPGWRDHEYRAFQEFVAEHDVEYRYLAFALLDRTVAVELTRV